MENALTVGISLTSIKKKIGSQCAWVDVATIGTLPPIVNPMTNADIDSVIDSKVYELHSRLGGYIVEVLRDDDVIHFVIYVEKVPQRYMSKLAHLIEEFLVWRALAHLYAPQNQACSITQCCITEAEQAESRLKQVLCLN